MGQNALKIKWRVQPDATCTTAVQLKMFSAEYISPDSSLSSEFIRFWLVFAHLDLLALVLYSCVLNKPYAVLSVQTRKLTAGVCYILAAFVLAVRAV